MIVYGDHAERVIARDRLAELADAARRLDGLSGGERHDALVALLIGLGGVAQGTADAEFAAAGADTAGPGERACMAALMAVARLIASLPEQSSSSLAGTGEELAAAIEAIAPLPADLIEIRTPEGFAHYALYPEAYLAAARTLRLAGAPRVVGIRSIGTALAPLVAVALGAPPPATVRPTGHPFAREVRIGEALAADLLDDEAIYVIVDEGPGLSGSSFGAVADWLSDRGVAEHRIVFLPGHGGEPGPQASARHRARWARATRSAAGFEQVILGRVTEGVAALVGRLDGPLEDISGGAWRTRRFKDEGGWPAVAAGWERRKYIARSGGSEWLIKFAGLGAIGARKLARAKALHAAGFGVEPAGLVHGFLVERWLAGPPSGAVPERKAISHHLGPYLAFRARAFGMPSGSGASLDALLDMARFNLGEAGLVAPDLERWTPALPSLAARVRRVAIDGRLAVHEWLPVNGRWLKTDALDHCESHDLIGCQDIAWDVAGAAVEFALSPAERDALADATSADAELIDFYTPCYVAFRIGWHVTAAGMGDATEAARHSAAITSLSRLR